MFQSHIVCFCSISLGRDPVYRCCRCYGLLQKSIAGREELLCRKGLTISPIPALKTFLATPWGKLAGTTTKESADSLLENIPGLRTFGDPGLLNKFCIAWDSGCPSCFDFKFEDPPSAIGSRFSSLDPQVNRMSIVLSDCVVLDDVTGEEITKTIHLEVISCAPLISSAGAEAFKFRAADESEHMKYMTFVPPPLENTTLFNKVEYWQLVRSIGPDSQALSLIRVGCLDSIFKNKVLPTLFLFLPFVFKIHLHFLFCSVELFLKVNPRNDKCF